MCLYECQAKKEKQKLRRSVKMVVSQPSELRREVPSHHLTGSKKEGGHLEAEEAVPYQQQAEALDTVFLFFVFCDKTLLMPLH